MRPRKGITEAQAEFIKKNYSRKTLASLVRESGLHVRRLKRFMEENGIDTPDQRKIKRKIAKDGCFNVNERECWFVGQ